MENKLFQHFENVQSRRAWTIAGRSIDMTGSPAIQAHQGIILTGDNKETSAPSGL